MEIVAHPPLATSEREALERALERAGIRSAGPVAYTSPWRNAGLLEAVDADEEPAPYAPSPRSTRGATRA